MVNNGTYRCTCPPKNLICDCSPIKERTPRNNDLNRSYYHLPIWRSIDDIDDTDDDTEDTLIISDEDFSDDFSETLSYHSEDEYVPQKKKKI